MIHDILEIIPLAFVILIFGVLTIAMPLALLAGFGANIWKWCWSLRNWRKPWIKRLPEESGLTPILERRSIATRKVWPTYICWISLYDNSLALSNTPMWPGRLIPFDEIVEVRIEPYVFYRYWYLFLGFSPKKLANLYIRIVQEDKPSFYVFIVEDPTLIRDHILERKHNQIDTPIVATI